MIRFTLVKLSYIIEKSSSKSCESFANCFQQLVLAFGNYMNQGNARIAGASAFRVGFLAKVVITFLVKLQSLFPK